MLGIKLPIGTDNTGLDAGVASAQKKLGAFKGTVLRTFAAVGAVTGISSAFRTIGNQMDRIGKLSRTGMDVDFIQKLERAGNRAGTSLEPAVKAVRMFVKEIRSAQGPSAVIKATLDGLGLSLDDLKKLDAQELFAVIASQVGNLDSETDQLAATTGLLGTRYGDLVPLLQDIAHNGMPDMKTATEETINEIQWMNDALGDAKHSLMIMFAPVLAFVAKLMSHFARGIEAVSTQLTNLIALVIGQGTNVMLLLTGMFTLDRQKIKSGLQGVKDEFRQFAADVKKEMADGIGDVKEIWAEGKAAPKTTGDGKFNAPGGDEDLLGDEGREAIKSYNKIAAARKKIRDDERREADQLTADRTADLISRGREISKDAISRNERFNDPASITASSMRRIGGGGAAVAPNEKIVQDLNRKQLAELGAIKQELKRLNQPGSSSTPFN